MSKRYLIILPETQAEISAAQDVLNYFRLNKKEITILFPVNAKIEIPEEINKITYSEEDISRLILPKKEFLSKLKTYDFDVVIDLNTRENFFLSVIAKSVKSKFIIGFKKENSDTFYNFQVANNQNNAEISYRNLLNSLLMF